jgi:hypothetical protein
MATAFFKLEEKRELSAQEVSQIGAQVLRVDTHKGKTTIYFSADEKDDASKELRSRASEVHLAEIKTLRSAKE